MPHHVDEHAPQAFEQAERRLFEMHVARCGPRSKLPAGARVRAAGPLIRTIMKYALVTVPALSAGAAALVASNAAGQRRAQRDVTDRAAQLCPPQCEGLGPEEIGLVTAVRTAGWRLTDHHPQGPTTRLRRRHEQSRHRRLRHHRRYRPLPRRPRNDEHSLPAARPPPDQRQHRRFRDRTPPLIRPPPRPTYQRTRVRHQSTKG